MAIYYYPAEVTGENIVFDAPHPEAEDDDSGERNWLLDLFNRTVGA